MLSKHHIIPISQGGSKGRENVAYVRDKLHERYHLLFSNKTPREIIDFLVNVFWGGNAGYLHDYLEEVEKWQKGNVRLVSK